MGRRIASSHNGVIRREYALRIMSEICNSDLSLLLSPCSGFAGDADSRAPDYDPRMRGGRRRREWVHVATVCVGEYVGLGEIDDGIGKVYFGPLKLGASLSPIRELKMRAVGLNDRDKCYLCLPTYLLPVSAVCQCLIGLIAYTCP